MLKKILLFTSLLFVANTFSQTNLMAGVNGDFEKGTLENWRFIEVSTLTPKKSTAIVTTDVHSGAYAAQVTWGVNGAIQDIVFDQLSAVTSGVVYTYKAWAKSTSGAFMLRIHCTYLNDANQLIGDYNDMSWILTDSYSAHSYTLPKVPVGATKVNIGFRAFRSNGSRWPATDVTCLIDDVELIEPPINYNDLLSGMNGNFETGTLDSWRLLEVGTSPTQSKTSITTDAHSGQNAAKITWATNLKDSNYINYRYNIAYANAPRNIIDAYLPVGRTMATKAVLLVPGGGWIAGDKLGFEGQAEAFAKAGVAAFVMNYRYADVAQHITYAEMIEDIGKALTFIASKADVFVFNANSFTLFGHSAGSHLALLYTYRNSPANQVNMIVALAAPTNLTSSLLLYMPNTGMKDRLDIVVQSTDNAKWLDASPLTHANSIPTRLYHGNLDEIIPYQQSEELFAKIKDLNSKNYLEIIPNMTHGLNTPEMIRIVNETAAIMKQQ